MAEMSSTLGALDLRTAHAVTGVVDRLQIFFIEGRVKAGPSAAGFKFRSGAEQLRITADAVIGAVVMQVPIFAAESRLRAALARHFILFRRELFFPFFVSLHVFRLQWNLAHPDPIKLFKKWFEAAVHAELKEPNAMTLATATRDGKPSARMVLLKGFDERGFVFYTNYRSPKGRDLERNPHAALVLFWQPLERQIRITGRVTKVSAEESDAYFHSRALNSRFSASISKQSAVIASRDVLLDKLKKIEEKYPNGDPPRPIHWGGFRVHPNEIEFWQGGKFRLHDRLRYRRRRDGSWSVDRLSP
jgi:pyridoxamine 5'-phosphate oxidase